MCPACHASCRMSKLHATKRRGGRCHRCGASTPCLAPSRLFAAGERCLRPIVGLSAKAPIEMNRLIELFHKYQDVISYLFFGGCSTGVNILSYAFLSHVLGMGTVPASALSWLVTVVFVYVTNRVWVFHSQAEGMSEIFHEFVVFIACRLATGVLDVAIMWLSVDIMGLNDLVMKIVSNVVVVVLNYIASKLIIFKRK